MPAERSRAAAPSCGLFVLPRPEPLPRTPNSLFAAVHAKVSTLDDAARPPVHDSLHRPSDSGPRSKPFAAPGPRGLSGCRRSHACLRDDQPRGSGEDASRRAASAAAGGEGGGGHAGSGRAAGRHGRSRRRWRAAEGQDRGDGEPGVRGAACGRRARRRRSTDRDRGRADGDGGEPGVCGWVFDREGRGDRARERAAVGLFAVHADGAGRADRTGVAGAAGARGRASGGRGGRGRGRRRRGRRE
ncbi:hypothetical protein ENSA5_50250 [Enhygromyxa salina]|uniref:Uncharacterized protein n=1 Tax=Enhygromyxa salina TaxID=215803 RepID=A0A2S9XH81_9BACT|nr:hypothetical protein ENSA5_50250 [Enhygromyxa salina]